MKKVLTLTLGGRENPSSNFRIRQYYERLKNDNWIVLEFNLKNIYYPEFTKRKLLHYFFKLSGIYYLFVLYNKYYLNYLLNNVDIIWINKYAIKEVDLSKTKAIIFQDIDDAIFYNSAVNFKNTLQFTDHVFCGNIFLKDEILNFKQVPIDIIPTPIDISIYPKNQQFKKKFVIGWLGSPFTNKYLLSIKDPLNKFLREHDSELLIISDNLNDFKDVFVENCRLIKWDERTYVNYLDEISVGLMPLNNSNWEKGKCSYKMLQYMACYKPVIVSPVGMNKEILDKYECGFSSVELNDWYINLKRLYENRDLLMEFGLRGRKAVEESYSIDQTYNKIQKIFNKYV